MFITMHCGGMPFNGETINKKSLGGSETAAYYMAKELAAIGHKVTIFTHHPDEGIFDDVRYVYAGEPNEAEPLGDRFHHYATHTPHDVLIIQRLPHAFHFKWASKINLLWLHDLALKRFQGNVTSALHNVHGVLTVSEFHKEQICEVYGINPDIVFPITNGVDLDLYVGTPSQLPFELDPNKKYLLYSSRPERGLENLVKPGGIMHTLWEDGDKDTHLLVCGYDNTVPSMEATYRQLWEACDVLPNVTNVGSLTKKQLAALQRSAAVHVYPTEFEEVSCITAMECMAAGLPFLSSKHAALPETCSVAKNGCRLVNLDKDGHVNTKRFISTLKFLLKSPAELESMAKSQLQASSWYSWQMAAGRLQEVILEIFSEPERDAILRHLIRMSDIYAAREYVERCGGLNSAGTPVWKRAIEELETCYDFAWNNTFDEHYKAVYEREEEKGVIYGPEELAGNMRFEQVSREIAGLPDGSTVMDYGCAHGHYTVNLCKRFPALNFIGVDIALSNIEKARQWALQDGVENVTFVHGRIDPDEGRIIDYEFEGAMRAVANGDADTLGRPALDVGFDAIIAAEVIEHVSDPDKHVDTLLDYMNAGGLKIITTPYGPWEAMGYREHDPWRAHLWHFERADLHEMWGHCENFRIVCVPSGASKEGEVIGSYVTTFNESHDARTEDIDYDRKFDELVPRETVSLCMIAKDCESTLKKCLDSVAEVVDEINIYIDPTTKDDTDIVAEKFSDEQPFWPVVNVRELSGTPLDIGFDAARNESIDEASGDWILWLDSDEFLSYPEHLPSYLVRNGLNGYGMKQHHFAVEPLGVMKTDYPIRLFRNHKGVQFYGVVHEHPEIVMNDGVGHAWLIPDIDIVHSGYTNEQIRRNRFKRNIGLMHRDREKYPERHLGKFLWIRDLSQMIGYEFEQGHGLQPHHLEMAKEGLELWDDLIKAGQVRMLVDGVGFYSRLVQTLGKGFEFSFKLDTNRTPGQASADNVQTITGFFPDKETALKFVSAIVTERVQDYGSKYE